MVHEEPRSRCRTWRRSSWTARRAWASESRAQPTPTRRSPTSSKHLPARRISRCAKRHDHDHDRRRRQRHTGLRGPERGAGRRAADRIAGAILITDGEVHDAPPPTSWPSSAPLHALIAGRRDETRPQTHHRECGALRHRRTERRDRGAGRRSRRRQGRHGATSSLRIDGNRRRARMSFRSARTRRSPCRSRHEGENVVEMEARARALRN